ncbi:MAG: glycosyltransferase [Desulfurococcaceae archaeon]|jgi:glycosyltransferase involved in cell wall biosynthesis|nr:glycosyltransferase [Desulfurococcaceae archaeon]
MRRAFIIAPNIGLSFGGGGGVKVALYMAQTLLENYWRVHLVSLSGWKVSELDRVHGTSLGKYHREEKLVLNYLFGAKDNPMIPFPIAVKLVASYIERLITLYSPDLVIFHDDIPKINEDVFKYVSSTILYSHFPYAVRAYFNIVDAVEVGLKKYQSYKTRLYYNALRRVVYCDYMPKEVDLVANSTVTRIFMEALWRRGVKVLYPPVTFQPRPLERLKDNFIVLVGGQPNKRVGDAVKALAELRDRGRPIPKLYVVAQHFVPWYKEWLTKLIQRLGLQQYVHFMENLPQRNLLELYTSAKTVLSTAHFEPFGMSIAEGMAFRAVPVVYRGPLSGPWVDIVDRGRYGVGFETTEELAVAIECLMSSDNTELLELQERAYIGFRRFSFEVFKESIIKLLDLYL